MWTALTRFQIDASFMFVLCASLGGRISRFPAPHELPSATDSTTEQVQVPFLNRTPSRWSEFDAGGLQLAHERQRKRAGNGTPPAFLRAESQGGMMLSHPFAWRDVSRQCP